MGALRRLPPVLGSQPCRLPQAATRPTLRRSCAPPGPPQARCCHCRSRHPTPALAIPEPKRETLTAVPHPSTIPSVQCEHFSRVGLFVTTWIAARQATLSMGFSRQAYWTGLPFLPLGDLPDPEIEPAFPASASVFFTPEPLGSPNNNDGHSQYATRVRGKTFRLSAESRKFSQSHSFRFRLNVTKYCVWSGKRGC